MAPALTFVGFETIMDKFYLSKNSVNYRVGASHYKVPLRKIPLFTLSPVPL